MFAFITAFATLSLAAGQLRGASSPEHDLGRDLVSAMDEVLGCGGMKVTPEHLEQIIGEIRPMWNTMPNSDGKLDWKSLRYIAHRHFMKKSSLLIRGLEPSRSINESDVGSASILSKDAPQHAALLFGGKRSNDYSIEDAAAFLSALEQLVFDSETHLLTKVYGQFGLDASRVLSFKQLLRLMEAYMVNWMVSEDEDAVKVLLRNRTLLATSFPQWGSLKHFVEGRLKLLEFRNTQNPAAGMGMSIMERRYTFQDAHAVVGGITQTFQDFWQSECHTMKDQLVGMDRDGNGRIKLSDFYGTGLDKDWRFGESETYLRDLGVLDESSPWKGKQVIIPNYLQAASNCIVAANHYLVCCKNECEEMLGDIEGAIGKPTAKVEDILKIAGSVVSPSDENEAPPKLKGPLTEQLTRVAEAHGGEVPLHGRLFAQWMHYAFPRECPFPHKAGSFAQHTLTPGAFGHDYIASKDVMADHVANAMDVGHEAENDDWMSQWSAEEELFADYTGTLHAPWECGRSLSCGLFGLLALVALVARFGQGGKGGKYESALPTFTQQKSHYV